MKESYFYLWARSGALTQLVIGLVFLLIRNWMGAGFMLGLAFFFTLITWRFYRARVKQFEETVRQLLPPDPDPDWCPDPGCPGPRSPREPGWF